MKVANTNVTNKIKNVQERLILNQTHKITMKVGDIKVTNVISNLPKQII